MNYLAPNLVTYLEMHHSDFNLCCFYPPPPFSAKQMSEPLLLNQQVNWLQCHWVMMIFCLLKLYRIVFLKENGQNITNIMLKVFKKFNLTFI